jgi:hypothetical protein
MHSDSKDTLTLVAEEAVEIRVLRRQGKSISGIARLLDRGVAQHGAPLSAERRTSATKRVHRNPIHSNQRFFSIVFQ